MPSLDSVTFDVSGFRFHGESGGERVWATPAGDRVALYYFPLKPDIGADVKSVDAIRQVTRSRVVAAGAAILEIDITTIDGCVALRQIIKVPQEPHGMLYLGSLILPFRDFSLMVKVQCHERGTTGIREAVVLDEAWGDGRVGSDTDPLHGWARDPYDPTLKTGYYTLAEAPEYDVRFPMHPLTQLRSVLAHLERTMQVTSEVRQSPAYVYS
jgi:hypothetical protein